MDYLIGINGKLLFGITEVTKLYTDNDEDEISFYNKEKKMIFFCNKMDCDFITQWEAGAELPEALKKVYGIEEEQEETITDPVIEVEEPE